MENKTCPICGNPTRVYMGNARKDGLCGYHADLLKAEKIVLKDGVYVYTNTGLPVGAKKEASTPKAAEQKAPEAKAATGICPIHNYLGKILNMKECKLKLFYILSFENSRLKYL